MFFGNQLSSLEIGEKGYKFERNYATSIFHFWENVKLQYNAGTKIGLESQNVYAHKGTRVKHRKKGNEDYQYVLQGLLTMKRSLYFFLSPLPLFSTSINNSFTFFSLHLCTLILPFVKINFPPVN